MIRYLAIKLLLLVPTLIVVSAVIFGLIRMIPGDPAAMLLGDNPNPIALAAARAHMGLDHPIPVQYLLWAKQVVTGQLGESLMTGEPVIVALLKRFTVTLQVVLPAFAIAIVVAVPAGLLAAYHHHRWLDRGVVLFATFCLSIPSFWMALLLIYVFGLEWALLPTGGFVSPAVDWLEGVRHLVLPVTALVFVEIAILTRMMRASAIEVLQQDYIAHARAKGIGEWRVVLLHTLPNAFAPSLTIIGLILGSLLSGTAVIETVFGLPGLGRFIVDAIYARDYPVIQGSLLFVVVIYLGVNLLVDLLYPLFDPRVKLS